jgi:hypothetical protein
MTSHRAAWRRRRTSLGVAPRIVCPPAAVASSSITSARYRRTYSRVARRPNHADPAPGLVLAQRDQHATAGSLRDQRAPVAAPGELDLPPPRRPVSRRRPAARRERVAAGDLDDRIRGRRLGRLGATLLRSAWGRWRVASRLHEVAARERGHDCGDDCDQGDECDWRDVPGHVQWVLRWTTCQRPSRSSKLAGIG